MRSVMPPQHDFSRVPQAEVPRSTFNRSHGYKTTFDGGYLIPIYVDECLPGDTFILKLNAFVRMSTPIVPVMDNIVADFMFFYVPLRLLQTNFVKLMGEQVDPGDSIAYLCPTIDTQGDGIHSLSDYLGIPVELTSNPCEVVSYHHRAYNLIYNTWIRDQNLQDSVVVDLDDGPDTRTDYVLLQRGKRHDYFTSCLPWPQKGDAVVMPLGTSAPITGMGSRYQTYASSSVTAYETDGSAGVTYASANITDNSSNNGSYIEEDPNNSGYPNVRADLTNATAATINELREAFQIQKLLERDARGGTRYIEKVKVHYGVTSPDLRAVRPVYLGGGSLDINMNPVAKTDFTAGSTGSSLSAFATGVGNDIGFTASFTEHGVLLGLVSVRADLTYQQGIDKMFFRSTMYDFAFPIFSHLGEQVVYNREIFWDDATPGNNTTAFGYQERYAEYRYKPSKITGLFRSDATGSIDVWHCSQQFGSVPTLDDTFIKDTPPFDRNIAVPSEPHFIYDSFINLKCIRPLPVYGVPGFIDHM